MGLAVNALMLMAPALLQAGAILCYKGVFGVQSVLIVGAGGFIGAAARYLVSLICSKWFGSSFPVGTLIVNMTGGFLIGFIMQLSFKTGAISPNMQLFLTTGILGGLTTFSTFSHETVTMFMDGRIMIGSINAAFNLLLSLAFVVVGKLAANII